MYSNKNQTHLNSTSCAISVCKLLQIIVNFDGLTFQTASVLRPFTLADKTRIASTKLKDKFLFYLLHSHLKTSKPTNSVST